MDDLASFGIELVDKLTRPGRRMAEELDRISKKLEKTRRFSSLTSDEFAKLAKGFITSKITSGLSTVGTMLVGIGVKAAAAGVGMAATAGIMITKGVVGMGMFADSSRRAFGFLLGGTTKGNAAFEASKELAGELGLDIQSTIGQVQKLMSMQFSIGEAKDMVRISADLQAIGASAEMAHRALVAITQIKAKGKLQAEELVGQLAEAGVATTMVYSALSKQLGKSEADVRKMLSTGKITADVGIKAIKTAIMQKVHETSPGQAAAEFNKSTMTGLMNQVKNLPSKLYLKAADEMLPTFERIKKILRSIIEWGDTIDTKKWTVMVDRLVQQFEALVPLVLAFGEGFGEGFSEFFAGLKASGIITGNLKSARDLGRVMGNLMARLIDALEVIANLAAKLATPTGKWVASLALGAGALGKMWGAYKGIAKLIGKAGFAKAVAKAAPAVMPEWYEATGQGVAEGAAQGAAQGAAGAKAPGLMARAWASVKGAAGSVAGFVVGAWGKIGGALMAAWRFVAPFGPWLLRIGGIVARVVGGISLGVAGAVAGAVASLAYLGYVIWQNWDDLTSMTWGDITAAFSLMWSDLANLASVAGEWIGAQFSAGWKKAISWLPDWLTGGTGTFTLPMPPEMAQRLAASQAAMPEMAQRLATSPAAAAAKAGPNGAVPTAKLSPQVTAAATTNHITTTVPVTISGIDHKGDPKAAGAAAGTAAADVVEKRLAALRAALG